MLLTHHSLLTVPASGASNPSLTGALYDWDGESGITITSSPDVDSWTDKVSSLSLAQGTASKKPEINTPADGFDAVNFDQTALQTLASAATSQMNGGVSFNNVVCVSVLTPGGTLGRTLWAKSNLKFLLDQNTGILRTVYTDNGGTVRTINCTQAGSTPANGVKVVVTWLIDKSNNLVHFYVNGSEIGTAVSIAAFQNVRDDNALVYMGSNLNINLFCGTNIHRLTIGLTNNLTDINAYVTALKTRHGIA